MHHLLNRLLNKSRLMAKGKLTMQYNLKRDALGAHISFNLNLYFFFKRQKYIKAFLKIELSCFYCLSDFIVIVVLVINTET